MTRKVSTLANAIVVFFERSTRQIAGIYFEPAQILRTAEKPMKLYVRTRMQLWALLRRHLACTIVVRES